jgi:RNA polymerase sigma-70 factor, ECF subfamily
MSYNNQFIEDEKLLVEMAISGNKVAFSKLFFNYKEMVYRVIYRLMGSSDYIDDAVQQTFIEIYKSLPGFESKSKFSTWIYRIAVNVSIQFLRKRRPHEKAPSIDPDDIESTFSSTKEQDSKETIKIINLALKAIDLKKRTVVVLHDVEGRTMEEISEIIGIPVGTVKSRLFHGREELKRKLEKLLEQV